MPTDGAIDYLLPMQDSSNRAATEFRQALKWISLIGVLATIMALAYLASTGELYLHMVVAVIGGVFLSVLLGCGLFAAAFFSDKSGLDEQVTRATSRRPD